MTVIKELFQVGAHFGFSKSRSHPSVKGAIFGFKNRSAVIDLEQTLVALERAKAFLRGLGLEGKQVLLVGNKDEARQIVRQAAEQIDQPYVVSRWLGGTFTNFPQIKSRVDHLADLKSKREKGELDKYTKKERLQFDKEITKLERYLDGLATLGKLPAAVLVIDSGHEQIVVTEARQMKIPVVSLSGTDCDVRGIAYPIIANDSSIQSIEFFVKQLAAAYEAGKQAVPPPVAEPAAAPAL